MTLSIATSNIMLSFLYAECRVFDTIMCYVFIAILCVIMLSVIMQSVAEPTAQS